MEWLCGRVISTFQTQLGNNSGLEKSFYFHRLERSLMQAPGTYEREVAW